MFSTFITQAPVRELWKKYYPELQENVLKDILHADPTTPKASGGVLDAPFGDYSRQIIKWYLDVGETPGNVSRGISFSDLRDKLQTYTDIRKFLPSEFSNINKFKTYKDFLKFMENTALEYVAKFKRHKAEKESVLFYENDEWVVRIPKTYFASNFFAHCPSENGGYEADWCTAYNPNHFNHYQGGTLLMILNKEDPKLSVQMFLSESDNVLKDYEDLDVQAGVIPEDIREAIEDKFHVDPVELFGGDDTRFEGYENIVISLNTTFHREDPPTIDGWLSVELQKVLGDGDPELQERGASEFSIQYFDYKEAEPSELVGLPEINFSSRGLIVYLDDKSSQEIIDEITAENPDAYVEDIIDSYEIGGDLLDLLHQQSGNGAAYFSYRRRREGEAPPPKEVLSYVIFHNVSRYNTRDPIISSIVDELRRFGAGLSERIEESLTIGGEKKDCLTYYSPEFGGLGMAIQNEGFARFLKSLPEYQDTPPVAYAEQEARDRQRRFEEMYQSRKRAMEHLRSLHASRRRPKTSG